MLFSTEQIAEVAIQTVRIKQDAKVIYDAIGLNLSSSTFQIK